MAKKLTKPSTPFEFIRYHSDYGSYHGVVQYGRKTHRFVTVSEFPIRCWKVKDSERLYFSNMGDLNTGIRSLRLAIDRHGAYQGAIDVLDKADNYLKGVANG